MMPAKAEEVLTKSWQSKLISIVITLLAVVALEVFTIKLIVSFKILYPYEQVTFKIVTDRIFDTCILVVMLSGLPTTFNALKHVYFLLRRPIDITDSSCKLEAGYQTTSVTASHSSLIAQNQGFEKSQKEFPWINHGAFFCSPKLLLVISIFQLLSTISQAAITVISWSGPDPASSYKVFIPLVVVTASCGITSFLTLCILKKFYTPASDLQYQ